MGALIYWGLRARAVSLWGTSRKNGYIMGRFEQKWSEKSPIEGRGTGIQGSAGAPRMPVPPSMSDFSDQFCTKRPSLN